jgi:8-hydroxy-5-deazaflavin:NADPH oxidoreductase
MRIGVLGTGSVGRTLATKLVELGHDVRMGSRRRGNERAVDWVRTTGDGASEGTFADAADHGEIVFNCTAGVASLEALEAAGAEHLDDKVLVDVANALDFSSGTAPRLAVCNTDSLAEQIQAAFPAARVVKTLNTVNAAVMADPDRVPGDHVIFMSGNDADAKHEVVALLTTFGWDQDRVVDLGPIETARGTEMYLLLWVSLMGALGTVEFNVTLARS